MKFYDSLNDPFGNQFLYLIDKNTDVTNYEIIQPERADIFLKKNLLENLPVFVYQNRLFDKVLEVGEYKYSNNITKLSMNTDISWNE